MRYFLLCKLYVGLIKGSIHSVESAAGNVCLGLICNSEGKKKSAAPTVLYSRPIVIRLAISFRTHTFRNPRIPECRTICNWR